MQPLANARRYGHKDICALLEAKGGFVKVHNLLTVVLSWLGCAFANILLPTFCLRMACFYLVRG